MHETDIILLSWVYIFARNQYQELAHGACSGLGVTFDNISSANSIISPTLMASLYQKLYIATEILFKGVAQAGTSCRSGFENVMLT